VDFASNGVSLTMAILEFDRFWSIFGSFVFKRKRL